MNLWSELTERLRALVFRSREERELQEELAFHLEMEAERNVRDGMSREEARRRALVAFGGTERTKEEVREARGTRWAEDLVRDLRLALRSLRRTPAFAATAGLILALGIGMAAAIATVFHAVLLRDLPVRDQDRVVVLVGKGSGTVPHVPTRYDAFVAFRERSRALEGAAGVSYQGAFPQLLRDGDRLVPLQVANVTGSFFHVLGTPPLLGRLFRPEDDVPGAGLTLVLSYAAWRRDFGGDPSVIGRRLLTYGSSDLGFAVIGVAPPGLAFPAGVEAWSPAVAVTTAAHGTPANILLDVVGRLAPGATAAEARTEFLPALRDFFPGDREVVPSLRVAVRPLPDVVLGDVRPTLVALAAAAGVLLLICCGNLGNLLLLRATGRGHEIVVRRVLGASFSRLVRQLFAESLVLALVGGALGLLLARALLHALVVQAPPDLPRLDVLRLAGAPLVVTTGVTLASVLLFGLAPALWAARRDVGVPLRSGGRGGGPGRGPRLVGRALVAWQVALAVMVLAGAGLVARSLARLEHLDLGYEPGHLAVIQFAWPWDRYGEVPRSRDLMEEIVARTEALPGVVAATPVHRPPFSGTQGADISFIAEGQSEAAGKANPFMNVEAAGPDYFRAFGLPLRRGRAFTGADREGAPKVVVVSEAVARRLFAGEDPVGKRIRFNTDASRDDWLTVVGVVGETRYRELRRPDPTVYFPYRQFPAYALRLVVRTRGEPASILPIVRREARAIDPGLDVWESFTMDQLLSAPLAGPRLNAVLLSAFGAAALLLAAIGLYGLMAAAVRQRMRELGIRLALGATPARLLRSVLRSAMGITGAGVVLGLAGAVAAARLIRTLLFQVEPTDPVTLAAATAVLFGVAAIAAFLPARRAAGADPVQALRAE